MDRTHHVNEYTQAMDEALAQLGAERPPVTVAEIVQADEADAVESIARKQEAWGEAFSEVLRLTPPLDADVWGERPRHTPDGSDDRPVG